MNSRNLIVGGLCLLLNFWPMVAQADQADAEKFYLEGQQLEQAGQAAKAVVLYERAIKSEPTFAMPYCSKARVLFYFASKTKSRDMLNNALDHFKIGLQLDEKNTTCYQARAVLWEEQKQYKAAIADYSKILEIKPQDLGAHMALAQAYRNNQQLKEALNFATKAVALTPAHDFRSLVVRGNIYSYLKDYSAAIVDYTEAIQRAPQEISLYFNRAIAYTDNQNFPAAIADYTRIIDHNPKQLRAYLERGYCYFQIKQCPAGRSDYQKACELGYQEACNSLPKMTCQEK